MASGGCSSHDHDCEAEDCAPQWVLYKYVDTSKVTCLNEATPGTCQNIFKPWHERTEPTENPLQSNDDDPELLLYVPFTGDVKLASICLVGNGDMAPSKMRAFINKDDMDFDTANSATPVQEWDLVDNGRGIVEYPTKVTKFINVHSLTLHFPDSFGGDMSEIHFLGFKGEFKKANRQAVEAVYEIKPMASEHKTPGENKMNHFIS